MIKVRASNKTLVVLMVLEMQILGLYSTSTESETPSLFLQALLEILLLVQVWEPQRQEQSFSSCIVHSNHAAIILKCRF